MLGGGQKEEVSTRDERRLYEKTSKDVKVYGKEKGRVMMVCCL